MPFEIHSFVAWRSRQVLSSGLDFLYASPPRPPACRLQDLRAGDMIARVGDRTDNRWGDRSRCETEELGKVVPRTSLQTIPD